MADAIPCAYVAIGKGGLLKVGYTTRQRERHTALKKEFRIKGDELDRISWCAPTYGAFGVEYALIRFCRANFTRHSGREWYTGASFDVVKAKADAETDARKGFAKPRVYSPEEQALAIERGIQYRAERDARAAARKLQVAEWKRLAKFSSRHRARRVFDAIASVCGTSIELRLVA